MPLSQLPAFLSACFDDLSAALDRRSAPRLFLLLLGALFAKGRRTVTSWFRAAGITTDFRHAYNALGPPADTPRPWPIACCAWPSSHSCVRPPATTCCSPSTIRRPPATVPRCRARASTTTPAPARPARSSSTATSGSRWPGWPTIPPGTRWPCRCVPCCTSASRTSPSWPSVTRGRFAPSWNWLSNWSVGCASGWAAWASNCVWSSMAPTPSVPSWGR